MQLLFWITLSLLLYTYAGYGLLLFLLNALFKKRGDKDEAFEPAVTFIVPAYNEEASIGQKIENTLALDYPAEKHFIIFITDGSTDDTPAIVSAYPRIKLLHQPMRHGKAAALNRAMLPVQTPVVVFSDANTLVHPQSLRKMLRHYRNEKVGGVSGEKRIAAKGDSAVSIGERIYWLYESWLKKANGDFYTLVGAAGELFSVRTKLFKPLNENVILDDFVLSATVCLQGYRFLYEAEAYGIETASATVAEERKRKVRISAGCYQALVALPRLLNPFRHFRLSFQYVSHRVLRWVVCPLAMPLLLVSSFFLFLEGRSPLYNFFFWGQCVFYLLALGGWLLARRKVSAKLLLLPYYFLFMVLSQYAGFYRFVTRRQSVLWEKARRQPVTEDH